jgi:hypothetical protein
LRQYRKLVLEPDWPRIRQLVARKLGTTEEKVEAMRDRGDSLDKAELVMVVEEVLQELRR